MNKYNEIEIQTAKNLLKEGYKWIARTFQGNVSAFSYKPYKRGYSLVQVNGKVVLISGKFTPLFQSINWADNEPTYIENIINPQILDDDEKKYLSAVIKPFRDKVDSICKENFMDYGCQRIVIGLIGAGPDMILPLFKSETMYKGMELGYEYTLEELGL